MAANQEIIFRARDLASGKILEVAASVDSLRRTVTRASSANRTYSTSAKAVTGAMNRVRGSANSLRRAFFNLRTAIAAFGFGFFGQRLIRGLIATSSEFENLRIQLNALQGSSEGGRKAFEWIKEFAKATPLTIQGVTESFKILRAFGLEPMDGSLQKIVDVSEKLGGGQEKLIIVTRAMGQMFSKSRVNAEEMSRQLTEAGIPAWDLLAKAMNRAHNTTKFTNKSLQKLAQTGSLGREEFKLLLDEFGRFGEGAALARMTSFTGLWSILGDEISKAKVEFTSADRGLFALAKGGVRVAAEAITKLIESGDLKRWGTDAGNAVLDAAERFIIGTASIVKSIKPVFDATVSGMSFLIGMFNALPGWAKPFGAIGAFLLGPTGLLALSTTIGALNTIARQMQEADAGGPGNVIGKFLGIDGNLLGTIRATEAEIAKIKKQTEFFASNLDKIAKTRGQSAVELKVQLAEESTSAFISILRNLKRKVEQESKININFDASPILSEISRMKQAFSLGSLSDLIVGQGREPAQVINAAANELSAFIKKISDNNLLLDETIKGPLEAISAKFNDQANQADIKLTGMAAHAKTAVNSIREALNAPAPPGAKEKIDNTAAEQAAQRAAANRQIFSDRVDFFRRMEELEIEANNATDGRNAETVQRHLAFLNRLAALGTESRILEGSQEEEGALERMGLLEKLAAFEVEAKLATDSKIRDAFLARIEFLRAAAALEDEIKEEAVTKEGIRQERLGAMIQRNAALQIAVDKSEAESARKLSDQKIQAAQDAFSAAANLSNALFIFTGQNNRKLFEATKAFNIAQTIMNTYAGATKAFVDPGGIPGKILAASIMATGLANVARISATSMGGGGGIGGAGGGGTPLIGANPAGPLIPQTQSQPNIEVTVIMNDVVDASAINWDRFSQGMSDSLGRHLGQGGSSGPVNIQFARA